MNIPPARSSAAVTVERFYTQVGDDLGLRLVAGAVGLKRPIREPTVNRPGLALAGFKKYFAPKRVQVVGNVEISYLRSLPPALRGERIAAFFAHRIPCVVLCRDLKPGRLLLSMAEESDVPLFTTSLITMKFISRATFALENLFAPRCIGTDAKRPATMIENDLSVGKRARQRSEFADLGMIEPGVETQVLARQLCDATTEPGVSEKTDRRIGR